MMVLRLEEPREHVVPAPADVSHLPPAVVVGGLAAHVDHAVDRRAAAQHLASRIRQRPAVKTGLGLGRHHPVGARISHAIEIADGDIDPVIAIGPARLEEQNGVARIGAQPVCKDAARRAGADDDEVVLAVVRAQDRLIFAHTGVIA
jgi:hypothetical protein